MVDGMNEDIKILKISCFILGRRRLATGLLVYEDVFAGVNLEKIAWTLLLKNLIESTEFFSTIAVVGVILNRKVLDRFFCRSFPNGSS